MSHTPGPWTVSDSTAYGNAPWQRRWAVNAKDPDASPASGYLVQVVSMLGDAKRAAEDAQLIAAAPDMLEALREIIEVEGVGCLGSPRCDGPSDAYPCGHCRGRAAISKALGKEGA